MKKRFAKFVCALITISCVLSIVTPGLALVSNNYTQWKQDDPAWNQQEAWPRSQYPNASMRYMSQAGCAVTAVAMLLRHYNVVTDSNVSNFNPWICNEKLKAAGALNSAADMYWDRIQNAFPGFVYVGKKAYSADILYNLYKSGYACMVKVNNSGSEHFVAIQSGDNPKNCVNLRSGVE